MQSFAVGFNFPLTVSCYSRKCCAFRANITKFTYILVYCAVRLLGTLACINTSNSSFYMYMLQLKYCHVVVSFTLTFPTQFLLCRAGQFNGGVIGIAYVGVICNPHNSVTVVRGDLSIDLVAGIMAHELGHTMYMAHDDGMNSIAAYIIIVFIYA